jgi:hypothetical protein
MKKFEIRHTVTMEEVFEVSFADNNDDEENKEEYPNSGNMIT